MPPLCRETLVSRTANVGTASFDSNAEIAKEFHAKIEVRCRMRYNVWRLVSYIAPHSYYASPHLLKFLIKFNPVE